MGGEAMMDRRELCLKAAGAALTAGCLGGGGTGACLAQTAGTEPVKSPCEKRMEWTEGWTRRFFETLDGQLDDATRHRLMIANGRACYREGHAGWEVRSMPVDELVAKLQAWAGADSCRRDGNTIHFAYKLGPDRRCLCPLVEAGPAQLSPTFCLCSVGYVTQLFETGLGRPVRVELVESLRTGGTACRFKIDLT
jgi:hypothetical protein